MALTVKDILTLPNLKGFQLQAGGEGLQNDVISAGIADYEFADGISYDLSGAFEKDSLVISSLLFAKDRPDLILPAIKTLKDSGVSAFAFKQILYAALPPEVLDFAEKNNLPVFAFRGDIWFENIIFDVMNAVQQDDARHLSESHIEKMIKGSATPEEINNVRRGISLLLDKTVSAAYVKLPDLDADRVYKSYYMSKKLRDKILVSTYEGGIFLLLTTSKWHEDAHRIILQEACETLSLPCSAKDITLSQLHPAAELHRAYQEGYFAWIASLISIKKSASFQELGVYTAILPLASCPELQSFSRRCMTQLEGYEDTIAAFVKNGGDIIAASVDLGCHANTVRYRLTKMKELLHAKKETDHELFRDLSIAYLVSCYRI